MMTLSQQIKEQADTIEMLSGERPVGVRLTWEQLLQAAKEMGIHFVAPPKGGYHYIFGLRVEIIDD
jgi:hypothetical protein